MRLRGNALQATRRPRARMTRCEIWGRECGVTQRSVNGRLLLMTLRPSRRLDKAKPTNHQRHHGTPQKGEAVKGAGRRGGTSADIAWAACDLFRTRSKLLIPSSGAVAPLVSLLASLLVCSAACLLTTSNAIWQEIARCVFGAMF